MAKTPASLSDSPAYKISSSVYRWLMVSLLWFLCSLPIVTVGAATVAGLGEFSDPENQEQHPLVKDFFRRFRESLGCSTGLWLSFLVLAALLVVDVTFYQQISGAQSMWMPLAALVLGMVLLGLLRFSFYCVSRDSQLPLKQAVTSGARTMILCLPMWAIMVVMDLVVLTMLVQFPYLLVLLLLLPGIYCNVHAMLIRKGLGRYDQDLI